MRRKLSFTRVRSKDSRKSSTGEEGRPALHREHPGKEINWSGEILHKKKKEKKRKQDESENNCISESRKS